MMPCLKEQGRKKTPKEPETLGNFTVKICILLYLYGKILETTAASILLEIRKFFHSVRA